MRRNNSLDDIRLRIRSLENLCFNSQKPIMVEKLDIDSDDYDSKYEASIRKAEFSNMMLLNEIIFYKKSEFSTAYRIIEEAESKLLSPDFYRDFIFDDDRFDVPYQLKSMMESLIEDGAYIDDNLSKEEYKKIQKMISLQHCPKSKENFLVEINVIRKKIEKEIKKFN